jgi:hypothetical protein
MRVSDLHRRILAGKKYAFLLDDYPNAAAAYSLRKLRTAYTGNCIEVRRSSDNTLQNIGFVNNVLDIASLLSFVGAGNGFVRTWYDQSLSANNAIQTDNARQPQIVSSGNILTYNGNPNILFNGTNNVLLASAFFNSVGYGNVFAIHKQSSQVTNQRWVIGDVTENINAVRVNLGYRIDLGNTGIVIGGRRIGTDPFQAVGNQLWSGDEFLTTSFWKWQEALLESYINGASNGSRVFQTAGITNITTANSAIGSNPAQTNFFFNGTMKEIVIYTSDQSANRTPIESNINSFYNIY